MTAKISMPRAMSNRNFRNQNERPNDLDIHIKHFELHGSRFGERNET